MGTIVAGAALYVLVSTMGEGIRPETWGEWTEAVLRAASACYFVDWLRARLDKAGQG